MTVVYPHPQETRSGAGTWPRCRRCKSIVEHGSRPDPCLGELPDEAIVTACCGHARPDLATVAFDDGREALHGDDAIAFFESCGVGPQGSIEERARNTA